MEIKKILCPVDFSDTSDLAIKSAKSMALLFNAELHLFHVVDHLHGHDHFMILQLTPNEIAGKLKKDVSDKLIKMASRLKNEPGSERLDISTEVKEGKAFVQIIKTAKKIDADLIVMGSHGRTALSHAIIGSVTERVVRKAPCHVLVVKDNDLEFEMP